MRSVLILFVAMDGNSDDSGTSQDILSGQSVDSRLSALEISIINIQQGLNAILQAQNISNQPATSGTSTSPVSVGIAIHAPPFVSVFSSQIATPAVTFPTQSGPSGLSSISSSQPLLQCLYAHKIFCQTRMLPLD